NLRTLVSFGLGFAILGFLFTRVQIDANAILDWVRQANPLLLLCAAVVFYATFPVRALRWRRLIGNAATSERRRGTAWRVQKLSCGVLSQLISLAGSAN